MSWQELSVAVVIAAAVLFLARKLVFRRVLARRPDVPLSRLRRPRPAVRD
jgi:hypothetical protein